MTHRAARQYALMDDGTATRVLVSKDRLPLKDSGEPMKIVLGSGFKSSTIESPYPVSAALQLNGDLTELDDDQLRRFGEAELERHHKVSFHSYDVEADYRVCVISDDPKRIDDFFDTYGGILEIEPLLIGTYHHDYETIEDIDISGAAGTTKGYTVNYTIKSPINRSRCTYCGICGSICPERCILEDLRFDFSRCTYCTDCVTACPVEAVDLYSIERISMEIPALIILGEPAISEPDNTEFLYRESRISDFLATIYSCRVDEVITCNHDICHFNGIGEAGCSACVSACNYGAVKPIAKEIHIDAFACTECGVCAAVCPTGALQNNKLTDQMFIEFFRSYEMTPHSRVVMGSDRSLHRFWWNNNQKKFKDTLFFEVPSDNSVAPLHLLFLVAHGADQIVILDSEENSGPELQRTVEEANLICSRTLGAEQIISIRSGYEDIPADGPGNKLTRVGKDYKDLSFINRRHKLSSVVQNLAKTPSTPAGFSADELRHWGTIFCDEDRCTQCLACLNVCKIESLSADQQNLSLLWNGGLCIGCGGCVATCPEQALTLKSSFEMTADFFAGRQISQAEPMRCAECGKVFGTRKSYDRVIALLTEKQGAPPDHLQYCDECRVLKLIDSK